MELKKTNEKWDRTFNEAGEESGNRLESASFIIVDDEGNQKGNAHVNHGNANLNYANLNISVNGFGPVEEGVAKVKELFGFE